MRLVILVNDPARVVPDQTTALLVAGAAARGWRVWLAGADALALLPDDRIVAYGHPATPADAVPQVLAEAVRRPREPVDLEAVDAVLLRTNPARDGESASGHEAALVLLAMARDRGVVVLNDPGALLRASSKLYLATLPREHRPRTLVTRDREALRAFVRAEQGRCVLKPLKGTRGQDVFFVDGGAPENLSQIVDVLVRHGVAMAQAYVPEAVQGDTRLLLLEGEPLRAGGHVAAVRRVPGPDELRSNVAQGGSAAPAVHLDQVLAVGSALGPALRRDGIFLAGVDVIGSMAVEINVFSPGGLLDAGAFEGVDFVPPILDALERRVRGGAPA